MTDERKEQLTKMVVLQKGEADNDINFYLFKAFEALSKSFERNLKEKEKEKQ